jgi:hypothetical protein
MAFSSPTIHQLEPITMHGSAYSIDILSKRVATITRSARILSLVTRSSSPVLAKAWLSSTSSPIIESMASAACKGTQWTIRLPDDFHHHVRDGPKTAAVLKFAAERFGRLLAMPNTKPPIVTTEMAIQYKQHILKSLPEGSNLEFIMTLYLTDNTAPEEILKAYRHFGKYVACKYYPAGATTNSDSGVSDVKNLYPVLEEMQKVG